MLILNEIKLSHFLELANLSAVVKLICEMRHERRTIEASNGEN